MKKHKTPVKTPLKLCTSTKKTPHTKTNDRYIPNRVSSNMEVGYHLLTHNKDSQQDIENIHLYDHVKRKLISDTCTGSSTNDNKEKVLSLHSRVGGDNVEQAFADNLKSMFNASACMNTSLKKSANRHVITQPEKILDAPEFKDDFCKFYFSSNEFIIQILPVYKLIMCLNSCTNSVIQIKNKKFFFIKHNKPHEQVK